MRQCKFSRLLWFLIFFQIFANSLGFFFPFENFFNRFKNNQNNGHHFGGGAGGLGSNRGGVSVFSTAASTNTATGNVTSISIPMLRSVPMLRSAPQRRVDVVTTVISKPVDESNSTLSNSSSSSPPQHIEVHSNVTLDSSSSDQQSFSQKLIVPTSTSITSSISASQQGIPVPLNQPHFRTGNSLTLPFTPNLFGMMSYVQALKDIKRNYKDSEKERKIAFMFEKKDGGDLMTRVLRTLIHKVVNKYQKQTEILKLKILKRQDKLQHFLQLPMVSHVIAMDEARAANGGVPLGNVGAGVLVPKASPSSSQLSRSGKPMQSILNSFLMG